MRRSNSLDVESIEDADGFDELALNENSVKQKIKLFEQPPKPETVRFVDFSKVSRTMKGKQSSAVSRTPS